MRFGDNVAPTLVSALSLNTGVGSPKGTMTGPEGTLVPAMVLRSEPVGRTVADYKSKLQTASMSTGSMPYFPMVVARSCMIGAVSSTIPTSGDGNVVGIRCSPDVPGT